MLQYGINEKDVKATGPKHNILKSDVMGFIKAGSLKPVVVKVAPPPEPVSSAPPQKAAGAPAAPVGSVRHVEKYVDIPLSNVRATIAKRLTQAKTTIPHEYQSAEVDADAILAIQSDLRDKKVAVSINDFIIKATALALRAVPEVNVRYSPESQQVSYLPTVDISVA
ncbi:2-oxo acid dehydrogenase acyltransferase, partial [Oesophagostomum dentatum]